MQEYSLIELLMERDEMCREEAEELVNEYRDMVLDNEMTIEDALEEIGVEPDYAFEFLGV